MPPSGLQRIRVTHRGFRKRTEAVVLTERRVVEQRISQQPSAVTNVVLVKFVACPEDDAV